MKFLIITSITEDLQAVSSIMEQAGITIFSVSETIGHKTEQHDFMPDNWFGKNENGTDALIFFSFTEQDKAENAVRLIKKYNELTKTEFPIRAFITPVEQSSY